VLDSSTRDAILVHLKRAGEAAADEIAGALAITSSAVRQHLQGLAADGLVEHREQKGGPGRPRHLYRLTAVAEARFPKTYSDLTNELLEYVQAEDPEMLTRLFARRGRRRLDRTVARLGDRSFDERVAELTRILDEDGYLADVEARPDGTYRIVEHNCAILGVAQRFGHACSSELEYIRAALPDASVERVAHMIESGHVCAYEVRPHEKEEQRGHRDSGRRRVPRQAGGRAAR
jgi:DeoR family suf operon transcriptional repressor